MVEVFKTNVLSADEARGLLHRIHTAFPFYTANFDLQDCDHILRVVHEEGAVDAAAVAALLYQNGFSAVPLPDEVPLGRCG
jgi:hypothetical protein